MIHEVITHMKKAGLPDVFRGSNDTYTNYHISHRQDYHRFTLAGSPTLFCNSTLRTVDHKT